MLESLSPVERAVFLLREVVGYGYDEIAGRRGQEREQLSPDRGPRRRQVESKKPRFEASREKREELSRRFFGAVSVGDAEGLIELLAADVVAYGDGGGKAPALPRPVYGRDKVMRLFRNITRGNAWGWSTCATWKTTEHRAHRSWVPKVGPRWVVSLDIVDGLVQTVAR